MLTLKCKVDGTNLTVIDKVSSVTGSVNYIRLEIDFDASWAGLIKTSYWRNAKTGKVYAAILQDEACYAPKEALTDRGYVYFAVAGEKDGCRVTTNKGSLWLNDTIYGGIPAQPPTPSQYDQMIEILRDTQQIAQSIREDADSGKFNGATGAKGDPGQAATIKIGSVTTGEAGSQASVNNTGTVNAAILDFTIPQGQPGEKGKQGEPGRNGDTPYIGDNGNWYIGLDDTGKPSRGEQGLPGQDGAPGKDGEPGKDGAPGENATAEQVQAAVDAYMQENPIETGATEEQAAQIARNTQDIQSLSADLKRKSAVIIASESGQPVLIEDSADAELEDLQMQGWTKQRTTTGAQLLKPLSQRHEVVKQSGQPDGQFPVDINGYYIGVTVNGYWNSDIVSFEYNSDTDTYTVTGKDGYGLGLLVECEQNVEYYISFESAADSNGCSFLDSQGKYLSYNSSLLARKVTTPENCSYIMFIFRPNGIAQYEKPMINKGNTAKPYEPYSGGQPFPSPDYPQAVTSAGEWDEGEEKYLYSFALSGANLWNTENEEPYVNGRRFIFDCTPYTEYTLSTSIQVESLGVLDNGYIDTSTPYAVNYNSQQLTFNSGPYTTLYLQIYNKENPRDYIVMLNIGETILPQEPYKTPRIVTLTSDRPLTKWDRLEKRDGIWGWVYKSKQFILTGNETVYDDWVPSMVVNISNKDDYVVSDESHYCTHFPKVNTSNTAGSGLSVRVDNYPDLQTAESFKAFLTKEAEQGTPVTIWAETIKETFVPFSESEQLALNALTTYYPTTVISNAQGCEMTVQYIADPEHYINQRYVSKADYESLSARVEAIETAAVNKI